MVRRNMSFIRESVSFSGYSSLGAVRQKRGLSASALAQTVGVSRQTIYAIEAGTYVPNTVVAIRLARVLDVTVEELFHLADEPAAPQPRSEQATLLPGSETLQPGQTVELCQVGKNLMASAPSPVPWYFPASDGIVEEKPARAGKTRVQVFQADRKFSSRILVAGCDPGISVLSKHVQAAGVELVLAHRNSSQSLELLQDGCIHVAGTHLRDEASGESNIPEVGRMFAKNAVTVISFAIWEEGIVTARGNPKNIRSIGDFARPDVTIVNRETGAGTRRLLDSSLKKLGIAPRKVQGYTRTAPGHLPAVWQVQTGAADCCLATRAAARVMALDFIPLASERYDLAIRRPHLELPGIQTLLDTLSRANFRRELESLGGYDTRGTGETKL